MKLRTAALGVAAGFLLALPVVVTAQEISISTAHREPSDIPIFSGGSGRTVPPGSLEVARAEADAAFGDAGGARLPLAPAVGTLITPADGTLITGLCELVGPGGVSLVVPEGATARIRTTLHGVLAFEAVTGTVFARNADLSLRLAEGGRLGATDQGRFLGVLGNGQAGRSDLWVTWRSPKSPKAATLETMELGSYSYKKVKGGSDPVSPSKGGRCDDDDDDDDGHDRDDDDDDGRGD
jgi:hypothetical protein